MAFQTNGFHWGYFTLTISGVISAKLKLVVKEKALEVYTMEKTVGSDLWRISHRACGGSSHLVTRFLALWGPLPNGHLLMAY